MALNGDPLAYYGSSSLLATTKIGILGAGIGGLYMALMLDSLGIKYEILESSSRTGGRLSTYKFQDPQAEDYDYYERGAMRFPLPKKVDNHYQNGVMKRLAELIEYPPLNQGPHPLRGKLIPYYFSARKGSGFYYFNGKFQKVSDGPKGPFNAQEMNVDADYARVGADAIVDDVLNPFARMLVDDIQTNRKTGWELMMENDKYSTSAYMSSKYLPSYDLKLPPRHLSANVINWCELLEDSTSGYNQALSETVLEVFSFASFGDFGDVEWKCFEGGTQTLSDKIEQYLNTKGVSVRFERRVTAIGKGYISVGLPKGFSREKIPLALDVKQASEYVPVDIEIDEKDLPKVLLDPRSSTKWTAKTSCGQGTVDGNTTGDCLKGMSESVAVDIKIDKKIPKLPTKWTVKIPCVKVTVNGNTTRNYSHVISTLPLPVLRTVDLNNAGLSVMQRNALRALNYGPSVKIAILFQSNWWTTELGIVGGQSYTDLPIRTIVYPSYGVDSDTPCKVLIASYTWTTDAYRLSSLSALEKQAVLKELVLRNLAEAHSRMDSTITYDYLLEQFVAMDVQDWNHDPHTMGAYAQFGPGNFKDLYVSLNTPAADKRLHFAGEAISVRHAWVVGALDSAWKAVYEYLKVTGQEDLITKFKQIWGENVEWTSQSTLVGRGQAEKFGIDLLDQHLGLVEKTVDSGAMPEIKGEVVPDTFKGRGYAKEKRV